VTPKLNENIQKLIIILIIIQNQIESFSGLWSRL